MMTKNELYLELKNSELNRVAMKFRKVFSNLMVLLFIFTLLVIFIFGVYMKSANALLLLTATVIFFIPMGVVVIFEKKLKDWYVKKRINKISSLEIDEAIQQSIAREIATLPKQIAEAEQNLLEMIKKLENNIQNLNDRYILIQELAKS